MYSVRILFPPLPPQAVPLNSRLPARSAACLTATGSRRPQGEGDGSITLITHINSNLSYNKNSVQVYFNLNTVFYYAVL